MISGAAVARSDDRGPWRRAIVPELERVQTGVDALAIDQFGVRALLDDAPRIQHHDLIGAADRRKVRKLT